MGENKVDTALYNSKHEMGFQISNNASPRIRDSRICSIEAIVHVLRITTLVQWPTVDISATVVTKRRKREGNRRQPKNVLRPEAIYRLVFIILKSTKQL